MDEANAWVSAKLQGKAVHPYTAEPPFSFLYNGIPSHTLLSSWSVRRTTKKLDAQRVQHTITYTDPVTHLQARCVAIAYHDFPTVEWTLYFKNLGHSNTPILSDIQALDARLNANTGFVLHHSIGSYDTPEDFEPQTTPLAPNTEMHLAPVGGRSTNGVLPYFNIAFGNGGVILVIGWPGQWKADFNRDAENSLHVQAGQELTHFLLHPGEQTRSPRIVLQFWHGGDWIDAQNIWRRWMMAYNMPRVKGRMPSPLFVACSSHQFGEMIHANDTNQKLFIARYLAEGLKIDYWWMDAGWYPNNGFWGKTGTWEVDKSRFFPHGLRPITDFAHEHGVKTILWFEPERVAADTWLWDHHPEWLLSPPPNPGNQADWKLLNLGNPQARRWLTDHISRLLTAQGIDLYRQDFNMDPLYYWRSHDAPDREGITEIRYVEGFLAYWDALRRRHPDMLIDSCASGGRRDDIDTLRRSVPLLRSDYLFEPVSQQCQTYGIDLWMPFNGTGTIVGPSVLIPSMPVGQVDPYVFRSDMAGSVNACWDMRRTDLDYKLLRRLVKQLREVQPYYLSDYYPLTPYSQRQDVWMAWQFNRPDHGDGVVQAFRRPQCDTASIRFRLRGLHPEDRYVVHSLDRPGSREMTGKELMERGLAITVSQQPGAAIIMYHRIVK